MDCKHFVFCRRISYRQTGLVPFQPSNALKQKVEARGTPFAERGIKPWDFWAERSTLDTSPCENGFILGFDPKTWTPVAIIHMFTGFLMYRADTKRLFWRGYLSTNREGKGSACLGKHLSHIIRLPEEYVFHRVDMDRNEHAGVVWCKRIAGHTDMAVRPTSWDLPPRNMGVANCDQESAWGHARASVPESLPVETEDGGGDPQLILSEPGALWCQQTEELVRDMAAATLTYETVHLQGRRYRLLLADILPQLKEDDHTPVYSSDPRWKDRFDPSDSRLHAHDCYSYRLKEHPVLWKATSATTYSVCEMTTFSLSPAWVQVWSDGGERTEGSCDVSTLVGRERLRVVQAKCHQWMNKLLSLVADAARTGQPSDQASQRCMEKRKRRNLKIYSRPSLHGADTWGGTVRTNRRDGEPEPTSWLESVWARTAGGKGLSTTDLAAYNGERAARLVAVDGASLASPSLGGSPRAYGVDHPSFTRSSRGGFEEYDSDIEDDTMAPAGPPRQRGKPTARVDRPTQARKTPVDRKAVTKKKRGVPPIRLCDLMGKVMSAYAHMCINYVSEHSLARRTRFAHLVRIVYAHVEEMKGRGGREGAPPDPAVVLLNLQAPELPPLPFYTQAVAQLSNRDRLVLKLMLTTAADVIGVSVAECLGNKALHTTQTDACVQTEPAVYPDAAWPLSNSILVGEDPSDAFQVLLQATRLNWDRTVSREESCLQYLPKTTAMMWDAGVRHADGLERKQARCMAGWLGCHMSGKTAIHLLSQTLATCLYGACDDGPSKTTRPLAKLATDDTCYQKLLRLESAGCATRLVPDTWWDCGMPGLWGRPLPCVRSLPCVCEADVRQHVQQLGIWVLHLTGRYMQAHLNSEDGADEVVHASFAAGSFLAANLLMSGLGRVCAMCRELLRRLGEGDPRDLQKAKTLNVLRTRAQYINNICVYIAEALVHTGSKEDAARASVRDLVAPHGFLPVYNPEGRNTAYFVACASGVDSAPPQEAVQAYVAATDKLIPTSAAPAHQSPLWVVHKGIHGGNFTERNHEPIWTTFCSWMKEHVF